MRFLRLFLFFAMLMLVSTALHAQNIDYLQKAREFLANGDCERAEYAYQDYKRGHPKGNAEIEAAIKRCKEGGKSDNKSNSVPTTGTLNGHEWVDLGLPSGTRWATCNVGADSADDYGSHYMWGETADIKKYLEDYKEDNYFYSVIDWDDFRADIEKSSLADKDRIIRIMNMISDPKQREKELRRLEYYSDEFKEIACPYLHANTLPSKDDVATVKWGNGWCMPTMEQWKELYEICQWNWAKSNRNDNLGFLVTGTNGNSIFLPAAGSMHNGYYLPWFGNYWSSSISKHNPPAVWSFDFSGEGLTEQFELSTTFARYCGQSVRPVCKSLQSNNNAIIEDFCHTLKDILPKRILINNMVYEVMPYDIDGEFYGGCYCDDITAFGKSDWLLPDKEELNALYEHRNEIGGFSDDMYWTSSANISEVKGDDGQPIKIKNGVWLQNFKDGEQFESSLPAYTKGKARCIRKY